MSSHDDSDIVSQRRRRVLQAIGAGALVTAVGASGTVGAQSSEGDPIDPNLGYTVLSPEEDLPVEPDHEVQLLINPPSDPSNPIPQFYYQPTGLAVETGDVVAFRFTTPGHTVSSYHSYAGRQQRVPDPESGGLGFFSSPYLGAGATWLYRFDTPGVYDYYCAPHEIFGHVGRIVVGGVTETPSVPDPCAPPAEGAESEQSEGPELRPPGFTAGLVLRDPALAPENILASGAVPWEAVADEHKQLFFQLRPPEVCGLPTDGEEPTPEATAYQVDLVVGDPEAVLGEDPEDFYGRQGRLLRYLHGSTDEPTIRRGTGSVLSENARCLQTRPVTVEDGVATVSFRVKQGCTERVSLVSYVNGAGPGVFDRSVEQVRYDAATAEYGPGRHTLTVALPVAPVVADLAGENEVPPVDSAGSGVAQFTPTDEGTWEYDLLVRDVDGVTQAHIHEGGPDENGPVVALLATFTESVDGTGGGSPVDATAGDPVLESGVVEDTALVEEMTANPENYYVNVHSTGNPAGEIRGQLSFRS
ncbi:CHRD domain-containing protein [Halomarina oriensis]|uniref:CHRD domain-containing protein n=1 Tax=Halomarina oriensis TaxID=671145 RepID=A0A6B0GKH4_9EURY|nr:CHRD domain-containing protein [Halomarina oriensis]MWG35120.1 CHRD domain-containing protein [Halomarina oriensis]